MTRRILGLALFLILPLSGCATTGTSSQKAPIVQEIQLPLTGGLSIYKTASIEVTNQVGKHTDEVGLLEAEIAGKLRNKTVFDRVYYSQTLKPASADLTVRLFIVSARFLSDWGALMGLMSGGAGVTYYLEFVDAKTQQVIGRKVFEAGCGGMEMPYTENVVNKASDKAVQYIQENVGR